MQLSGKTAGVIDRLNNFVRLGIMEAAVECNMMADMLRKSLTSLITELCEYLLLPTYSTSTARCHFSTILSSPSKLYFGTVGKRRYPQAVKS